MTFRDRMVLFVLWVLSLVGAALFGYFLHLTAHELFRLHDILSTFQPVTAHAISASSSPEPERASSGNWSGQLALSIFGPDHEARVSFAYEVDGHRYNSGTEKPKKGGTGNRPVIQVLGAWSGQVGLPGRSGRRSLTGSESWARAVVAAHAPGEECTAYYDPNDPSRSFLLREPDFSPYLGALLALLFSCLFGMVAFAPLLWLLGWLLWALGRYSEEAQWPVLLWVGLWAVAYLIGGGTILGHYFLYSDQPFGRSLAPVVGIAAYVLPPAALWYYVFAPQLGLGWATPTPASGGKNTTDEKRAQRKQEREAKKRNRSKKK
jgi:hypothetical protein